MCLSLSLHTCVLGVFVIELCLRHAIWQLERASRQEITAAQAKVPSDSKRRSQVKSNPY